MRVPESRSLSPASTGQYGLLRRRRRGANRLKKGKSGLSCDKIVIARERLVSSWVCVTNAPDLQTIGCVLHPFNSIQF